MTVEERLDRIERKIGLVAEEQDDYCEFCGQKMCGCEAEDERDEWPQCGCPLCFCMDRTEYGEPCASCCAGAHQG